MNSNAQNWWKAELGWEPTDSWATVQAKFRTLARRNHPNKGGVGRNFGRLQKAKEAARVYFEHKPAQARPRPNANANAMRQLYWEGYRAGYHSGWFYGQAAATQRQQPPSGKGPLYNKWMKSALRTHWRSSRSIMRDMLGRDAS